MMYRFLIIIEPGSNNYSAYVPDLPGCIATGKTLEEVKANMSQAIEMHIQGMIEDQEPLPVPETTADYLDIPIPISLPFISKYLYTQQNLDKGVAH